MQSRIRQSDIIVVSHKQDFPSHSTGKLLPVRYGQKRLTSATQSVTSSPLASKSDHAAATQRRRQNIKASTVLGAFLLLGFFVSSQNISFVTGDVLMAAPMVVVQSDVLPSAVPLHYGASLALSVPDFFTEARAEFLASELSFIEADLSTMQIVYYKDGVEVFSAPILSKGKEGSWWETPAGLYQISYKAENHFSSFGQVYQPWSMAFQGNFFVHGWPEYADGTPVPEGYSGGCIRLATTDAATLFDLVEAGTPILVHEENFAGDGFIYEATLPDFDPPHYLLADIESNSVLLSSELEMAVPIASLTKLMTALVAAEYINLDTNVPVTQEHYVTTMIPRLSGNNTASMYSLLQLLLVESSNEAAEVIAAQVGRDRFIKLMNDKAQALGLSNTTFTDPSGLDNGNVSSVDDLYRLAQYIYHNRSFILELTANQNLPTAYTGGQFGELNNFNLLEIAEDTFIGGKIGETLAAGQTSLSLHKVLVAGEERVLAVVVLGSSDRSADVAKLLEYVSARFSP